MKDDIKFLKNHVDQLYFFSTYRISSKLVTESMDFEYGNKSKIFKAQVERNVARGKMFDK